MIDRDLKAWLFKTTRFRSYYIGYKSSGLLGGDLDRAKFAYQAKLLQRVTLAKAYKVELLSRYESSGVYGVILSKAQYRNDVGISHSFAAKKANVKLSVTDIFNTFRENFTENYQTTNMDSRQKKETRIARLTFTYNFGSSANQRKERQSGTGDLKGRVEGAN